MSAGIYRDFVVSFNKRRLRIFVNSLLSESEFWLPAFLGWWDERVIDKGLTTSSKSFSERTTIEWTVKPLLYVSLPWLMRRRQALCFFFHWIDDSFYMIRLNSLVGEFSIRVYFFVSKLSLLLNTVRQDEEMKFFFPLFQFYFVAVSFVSGRKLAWKWMAIKHGVFLQTRFPKLYAGVTIRFMSVNHFTGICMYKKTQREKKTH